jgi:hypothetical protein
MSCGGETLGTAAGPSPVFDGSTDLNTPDEGGTDAPEREDAQFDGRLAQDARFDAADAPLPEPACSTSYSAWSGTPCVPAGCMPTDSPDSPTTCGTHACLGSEWCEVEGSGVDASGTGPDGSGPDFYACHPKSEFTCAGGACCWEGCSYDFLGGDVDTAARTIRCHAQ